MRMNFGELLDIRDLGDHSAMTVINLAMVLAGEVNATRDPKRKDLYEIETDSIIYYIYVSPFTGAISLIATWKNANQPVQEFDVVGAARE